MNKLTLDILEIHQPIGVFYLSKLSAKVLCNAVNVLSRKESSEGVQRVQSRSRINEIARYCSDPDATFPTSIIISINDGLNIEMEDGKMTIEYDNYFGDVIDGQHRLYGIQHSSNIDDFELPIVLMPNLTIEEKAYVFSIINSKQEKVDKSLIYDLFDVSKERSPQKTVHEIARSLNSLDESPFKNRLKMLGRKEENQPYATLTQGTFSKRLIRLISKNPDDDRINIKKGRRIIPDWNLVFRQYFIDNQDHIILKVLLNCFCALKNVFPETWENPKEYILWKTTGFNAIMDSIPKFVDVGKKRGDLSISFFEVLFVKAKDKLEYDHKKLTSENFSSGEKETKKLGDYFIKALDSI